jgi:hypothetical protein
MPAIHLNPRRGRSAKLWSFVRQPLGPPIRSETPYSFAVVLEHENKFVMGREDADPVYRGDVVSALSSFFSFAHKFTSRFVRRTRAVVKSLFC